MLTACSGKPNLETEEKILFSVNDIDVSVFQFQTKYVLHLINTGRNDSKEERYRFVNQYIDNLVLAEASPERGLLNHPIYLAAIEFQERKSMADIFFVDEMNKIMEPPTDDEVRLAYAKKQRKVYVRQLFSRSEADLNEAHKRLESGENFVDVANDFFDTPDYDSTAGYLGPISYFGADDAFAEAAYSMNVGEFSKPIRSQHGYHIVYVEYLELPAILTEDGYQYQKQGVTSQIRLRKQRLTSNSYVRDLMSTLRVEVDPENLAELRNSINRVEEGISQVIPQNNERESDFWEDDLRSELSGHMDTETILATFVLGGEKKEFTFSDYLNWLPYLPYNESKNRTGASLGRALRNEVFYLLALENSYHEDERVQEKVKTRGYEILSELYQAELAREALADTNRIEVPESFRNRLIRNKEIQIHASYWKILAEDMKDAERIKAELQSGESAESYSNFTVVEYQVINPSDGDHSLVKKSILKTPLIAYSADEGWMVFYLSERQIEDITVNTRSIALERQYKVFSTINSEIEFLRKQVEIKLDTLLFDEIYELKGKEVSE
ncbi:MAG: peptidylprolyl isomerase [Balneola sp.]